MKQIWQNWPIIKRTPLYFFSAGLCLCVSCTVFLFNGASFPRPSYFPRLRGNSCYTGRPQNSRFHAFTFGAAPISGLLPRAGRRAGQHPQPSGTLAQAQAQALARGQRVAGCRGLRRPTTRGTCPRPTPASARRKGVWTCGG